MLVGLGSQPNAIDLSGLNDICGNKSRFLRASTHGKDACHGPGEFPVRAEFCISSNKGKAVEETYDSNRMILVIVCGSLSSSTVSKFEGNCR
jgi:hypothetical protein